MWFQYGTYTHTWYRIEIFANPCIFLVYAHSLLLWFSSKQSVTITPGDKIMCVQGLTKIVR